jgi:hypothetical protein
VVGSEIKRAGIEFQAASGANRHGREILQNFHEWSPRWKEEKEQRDKPDKPAATSRKMGRQSR